MELRHLRYFVAVAETLSFTAAASRLNISQPPLSQQIRDLEEELGTALFERTSRRVRMTAAGISFLEHAHSILAQTEIAARDARAIGGGEVGAINIGTTGSVLLGPLTDLIGAFSKDHPGVAVRISEMGPFDQYAALLTRRIDISFLRKPRRETELVTEIAWHEKVGVVLPKTHPLANCTTLPLSALKDQNLVFLRLSDSRFARYLRDCCIESGFMPKISHEAVESYSLVSLVAAGLGLALAPECVRKLPLAGVVYRPLQEPVPIADVKMMYRPDHSEVIDRFVKLSRQRLRSDP